MARISMAHLARVVGVSKNSVSVALAGKPGVSEATRSRIKAAATRLGYRLNPAVADMMTHLRVTGSQRWKGKLALVNAHRDPLAFSTHPTIPAYVDGCEKRAASVGYGFDRFWLHDPDLKPAAWLRILRARGIVGIVVVGLMETNRLPPQFTPVWAAYPTVVTGVRTHDPALSYACVDHYGLTLSAFDVALEAGYRRPALVLDEVIDELLEHRFSAGFIVAQHRLPRADRIAPFTTIDAARANPRLFRDWLERARPDVLFTLYNVVFDWLEEARKRVPHDVGVIQLEWRRTRPDIAGMDQRNDLTGEAAVDMVLSQIHNNETGVQEHPRATLIRPIWMDGRTIESQTSRRKAAMPA